MNYSNILDVPLIGEPINGLETVQDIYISDSGNADRWRSYMNYKQWDPRKFNDEILKMKMYHARVYTETTILDSIIPSDWVIGEQVRAIQELAAIHMRKYEFEIAGFQLLTGNIAITTKKEKREDLRMAAAMLYTSIFWWLNQMPSTNKIVSKSKKTLGLWKPLSVDSAKCYARHIDNLIETMRILLKLNLGDEDVIDSKKFKKELGVKLRNCILSLDKVLIIL